MLSTQHGDDDSRARSHAFGVLLAAVLTSALALVRWTLVSSSNLFPGRESPAYRPSSVVRRRSCRSVRGHLGSIQSSSSDLKSPPRSRINTLLYLHYRRSPTLSSTHVSISFHSSDQCWLADSHWEHDAHRIRWVWSRSDFGRAGHRWIRLDR